MVKLLPGIMYYPNIYLTPDTINTDIAEESLSLSDTTADYGTQHFSIYVPDDQTVYTMRFSMSGRHAMRVYVNGTLQAETGKIATTKQDTEVWENNIVFYGTAVNGKIDIILNNAEFYHAHNNSKLAELWISKGNEASLSVRLDQLKGFILMGAFLCAAILLIGIYLMLSRTSSTLFFSIACIVMALRESIQSQAWVYFPISGNTSFRLEYLTLALLTVFLSLYMGQYVSDKILRGIQIVAIIGSCAYGLCVVFGDSLCYTSVLQWYRVLLGCCIIPGILLLFYKMKKPNTEQRTAIYGISVFFLAALIDMFQYTFQVNEKVIPISEIAMFLFAVSQTVSLFQMNNRVLVEIKQKEQKLEADKEILQKINQLKTEFLGNVTHELKTPLTVMSGYAQTTRQLAENKEQLDKQDVARRMNLISSESERLSLMITQILDFTRMEEGQMTMEVTKCYIDEIIHAVVKTHYPVLNQNGNRLIIHMDNPVPQIYADSARISQVILNLLSNAIQYTVNGSITITVENKIEKLFVRVSDTGEGIEQESLPHIFERYYRGNTNKKGKATGTGLGLYICQYIVEQHGGKIWAESEIGKGTTISFSLPLIK